jgi:hypothetical protein
VQGKRPQLFFHQAGEMFAQSAFHAASKKPLSQDFQGSLEKAPAACAVWASLASAGKAG